MFLEVGMNNNDLINLIVDNARDHTIEWMTGDNIGVSKRAQGWLDSIPHDEKALLSEVVAEAIDLSLIKTLELIDGCQSYPEHPIELHYQGKKLVSLNNEQLHDLYASKVEEP